MQNMEQKNSEIRELTDAELEAISGGNWLTDIGGWIVRRLKGPGDLRPATRRPD
ncbi:MAG: bacteriocin [Bradyrhizobium sp.]|nr:bacteriocin [Bradyrhizobium sp.]